MEIPVLLQSVTGNGYRASVSEPFGLSAEGSTREAALQSLQQLLNDRANQGDEIVTLRLPIPHRVLPAAPVWPDDEITRAWLAGIAEHRQQSSRKPDPWDPPGDPAS